MFFNNFQVHDLLILLPSLACLVLSIVLYAKSDHDNLGPALILLLIASLGLRIFMAHLDPFLWDWDERYHALVAKNLLKHPLIPTLYDKPVLPYDYFLWNSNHIWMHKQPLPLWQMALSFYMFGVSQFTARFPMVIEGVLLTLIIYRIGTLSVNKQVGYLSALIYTSNFYALDFMSGGQALDHIDFALVFYVSASLWAWLEYRDSQKIKWVILTGIFAGLAFMSKWVLGLLIFPAWGIVILVYERKTVSSYLKIALAFMISALVFLPWQIYAYWHFPVEYKFEMNYNSQQHIMNALGGHTGSIWYYFINFDYNYGYIAPFIILFALAMMWLMIRKKEYFICLISFILLPYLMFSFIAATKMPAYCYLACAPVYVAMGCFAYRLQNLLKSGIKKNYRLTISMLLIVTCFLSISLFRIAKIHTGYDHSNYYRINKVLFTDYFRKINKTVPKDYVIFGLNYDIEIDMMFYTGNTCYGRYPTAEEYRALKKSGTKIAAIIWKNIPDYLQNDPDVLKLKWL